MSSLEIVQIDHTQADVLIVDRFTRKVIGRPWLSVAIDLATRTVPAFFIGMERPGAGTAALLARRILQPKAARPAHPGLPIHSPLASLGRYFCFVASLPNSKIGCMTSEDCTLIIER